MLSLITFFFKPPAKAGYLLGNWVAGVGLFHGAAPLVGDLSSEEVVRRMRGLKEGPLKAEGFFCSLPWGVVVCGACCWGFAGSGVFGFSTGLACSTGLETGMGYFFSSV
jgi:hypothetical protein